MPNFDFVTTPQFRAALEADYKELKTTFDSLAWKSVQVLAGCIVEAVLIDYLQSTTHSNRPRKDPLKLDLAEAITICKSEGAISDRTGELCSVIRSYRNLIHPGRVIRTLEAPPSSKSAQIAVAVVDLILEEISSKQTATLGLTAEQLLSKVERDQNSLPIFKHLLAEAKDTQIERLVMELLPARYFSLRAIDGEIGDYGSELNRFEKAYRLALDYASDAVKQKAAERFVQVVREGDGDDVSTYSDSFFLPSDLKYVSVTSKPLVRQHLLARLPSLHDVDSMKKVVGLLRHLEPEDVVTWLDPFIRAVISPKTESWVRAALQKRVASELSSPNEKIDIAINRRFDGWLKHLRAQKLEGQEKLLLEFKMEIDSHRLPF